MRSGKTKRSISAMLVLVLLLSALLPVTAYAADEGSERLPGDYPPALVRVLCFMWRQGGVVSVGCSPPETTEEPLSVPPCAPSGIGSATLTPLNIARGRNI